MTSRPKVLIANDDGIHATGIQTLTEWLSKYYDVVVAAPDRERSAMGHALTLHKPLRVEEVSLPFPVQAAYAVTGTPSDCVKIALNAILDSPPDVIVSGINHGPNIGADVLYSGTVSAALEGAIHGIPSVAISLMNGYEKHADFTPSAEFLCHYLPRVLKAKLPPKSILNINTPAVEFHEVASVCITRLGERMYTDTYEKRTDPRGGVYYWLAGEMVIDGDEPGTDVAAMKHNCISVTPIQFDLTNHTVLEDTAYVKTLAVDHMSVSELSNIPKLNT